MADGRQKGRELAAERATRTVAAWGRRAAPDNPDPYVRRTRHGEVRLDTLTGHQDAEGNRWVEVMAGGGEVEGGDPHFRIFNPPTLVEDPAGPVHHNGRRYREDPLAALAEVIGMNGGATRAKRHRRTRG